MKRILFAFGFLVFLSTIALGNDQPLKVMKPKIGGIIDISQKAQDRYRQWSQLFDKVYAKNEITYEQLTPDQKKLLGEYDETLGFWDTIPGGCSWYCGGGPNRVEASSQLPSQGKITYFASNAHDGDLRTAWIEGAKGYGIGEHIEFHFEALSPRVTEIIVYNGYYKSEQAWDDNARIKTMKLYVNDKLYALLELYDTRAFQSFTVSPMQSKVKNQDLVLRFEILDVYKGNKWEDVAVSEINFNGLDVHCFVQGTMIKMAKGKKKAIEKLEIGDKIKTYNLEKEKIETSTIEGLVGATHRNLVRIDFENDSIISTDDHPYVTIDKEWASVNPEKTRRYEGMNHVKQLDVGDRILILKPGNKVSDVVIKDITYFNLTELTYTITKLDKNVCFFANGCLVGVEDFRDNDWEFPSLKK